MISLAKKKNNKILHSVRYLAMEILEAIETEGAYSNILLNATIEKEKLDAKDAGLLTTLVYGVTQRKLTIDYGLEPYIRSPKKLENWVKNLIRLSVYQMVYLDKVPDHAVLFEAVEIAKIKGHVGISKLVNGILRNVQRNGLKDWQQIENPTQRISIGASVPEWLVKKFVAERGLEKTEALFFSLLTAPYISIRVQNASELNKVIEDLESSGIQVEKSPLSPVGLRVLSGKIVDSPLFKDGTITIQDESSQLVALLGSLKPVDYVLDACAAPGGKTAHIASFIDSGLVHALDIYDHKIRLVRENAKRLQVSEKIKTHILDAKNAEETFEKDTFDKIFVDAPCSGLGLMRRKPEIKYGLTPNTFNQLQKEQLEILNAVVPLLKKGGRLVYSTCTLAKEENQEVVKRFLSGHSNMQSLAIDGEDYNLPSQVITAEGMVEISPEQFGTDGFFICIMEKKK